MRRKISPDEVWINFEQRSINKYAPQLAANLYHKYGPTITSQVDKVNEILTDAFSWCTKTFETIVKSSTDLFFLQCLFQYHEASVLLWMRVIKKEDINATLNITEESLSMNRRTLKLALELCSEVNYIGPSQVSEENLRRYDELIEDLLFIGSELIGITQYRAEIRMLPGTFECQLQTDAFHVSRLPEVEAIFSKLISQAQEDYTLGIFDEDGVTDLKQALKHCMQIDYDQVGALIAHLKQHHGKGGWRVQTIEPSIIVKNLIQSGVSKDNADAFWEGLVLGRHNKLSIENAVYKVNSIDRHLFKPVLLINHNGNNRELIGVNKWAESITVLATNGFQWERAADEWKGNRCFNQYILGKALAHDKLLENKVEEVLNEEQLPYLRNVNHFSKGPGHSVRVDVKNVGEMDFVWVDTASGCIIVADCKYSRARYDMIAYSADYSNFTNSYEPKIENKRAWIETNKELVCDHFRRVYPDINLTPASLTVKSMFIINTPTFYMYFGKVTTVSFFRLQEIIKNKYTPADLAVSQKTTTGWRIKIVKYPYFR